MPQNNSLTPKRTLCMFSVFNAFLTHTKQADSIIWSCYDQALKQYQHAVSSTAKMGWLSATVLLSVLCTSAGIILWLAGCIAACLGAGIAYGVGALYDCMSLPSVEKSSGITVCSV